MISTRRMLIVASVCLAGIASAYVIISLLGIRTRKVSSGSMVQIFFLDNDHLLMISQEPNGKSASSHGQVALYNINSSSNRMLFQSPWPIGTAALSNDKSRIAVGGDNGTVEVWDLEKERKLLSIVAFTGKGVNNLQFSPDGTHLELRAYTVESTGTFVELKALNFSDGALVSYPPKHGQIISAFTPNRDRIALIENRHSICVRSLFDETVVSAIETNWPTINCVAFSGNGKYIVAATGEIERPPNFSLFPRRCEVAIWEVKTGQRVYSYKSHTHGVICVALSTDGKRVASGDLDGRMVVLSTQIGNDE